MAATRLQPRRDVGDPLLPGPDEFETALELVGGAPQFGGYQRLPVLAEPVEQADGISQAPPGVARVPARLLDLLGDSEQHRAHLLDRTHSRACTPSAAWMAALTFCWTSSMLLIACWRRPLASV